MHPSCVALSKACLKPNEYESAGAEVFKTITTETERNITLKKSLKKTGEPVVSRKKRCQKRRHASGLAVILLGGKGGHHKGCSESSSEEEESSQGTCNQTEFNRYVRWMVTAACPKTCNVCEVVPSKTYILILYMYYVIN